MSEEQHPGPAEAPKQWYQRGFGGLVQEQIRIESSGEPDRFYLKANEEKRVTAVDDEPFQVHEHQFRGPDGKWGAHVTCLEGIHDEVPCCDKLGTRTRSLMSFLTIVNIDGYKTRKGDKVPFTLQLLALKYKAARLLEKEKLDEVTLIGRNYRVSRTNGDAAGTGDLWKALPWELKGGPPGGIKFLEDSHWGALYERVTYRGKKLAELIAQAQQDEVKRMALSRVFDLESITNKDGTLRTGRIPPFNYMQLFQPRTPREVAALVKGAQLDDDKAAGGAPGKGPTPTQDDTTF